MKKLTALWMIVLIGTLSVQAMSLSTMRRNVRFLTDRMAYELQLTSQQYNDVYEVNFDFVYNVDNIMREVVLGYDYALDNYYNFLNIRNDDLRWILTEYQYRRFMDITYFYRPISLYQNSWRLGVFNVYTNVNFFYFGKPHHYRTYLGGHYRTHFGNRSYYELHHHDHYRGHSVFAGAFHLNRGHHAPVAHVAPKAHKAPVAHKAAPAVRPNKKNEVYNGNARSNYGNHNVGHNNNKKSEVRQNNGNVRRQDNPNLNTRNSNNVVRRQNVVSNNHQVARPAQRSTSVSNHSNRSQQSVGVRSQSSRSSSSVSNRGAMTRSASAGSVSRSSNVSRSNSASKSVASASRHR